MRDPLLLLAFSLAAVVGLGLAHGYDRRHPPLARPCAAFADTPSKDVPARCTKTYAPNPKPPRGASRP